VAENNLGGSGKEAGLVGENSTEAVLRWLGSSKQEWLLLFDNCEGTEALPDLIPSGDRGNVLYTSRDPALGLILPRNAVSEVSTMESEDAITLLFRASHLEGKELDDGLHQRARRIVEALGFLPLAIDIAGAFIRMGRCYLEDYMDTFHKHREEMMKDSTFKGASRYNQAVYTTWDISYNALREYAKGTKGVTKCQDAKAALQLLHLFAFVHNESIMEEIFKRAAESRRLSNNAKAQYSFDYSAKVSELLQVSGDGIWDPFLFRKGLSMLLSLSLVTQDQSRQYFSMHVLVHSWARDHMPGAMRPQQASAVAALLSSSINWRFLAEDYAFRRQLLPHIRSCKKHRAGEKITESEDLEDASNFSLVFFEAGHWREAEVTLAQVMKTRQRVLGEEHPDTLTSMANLASTYRNQGRWKEAEELDVQVMETRKRVLGEEHPDTLSSMANLASTFWNQGRWKEAEELEVQVMETRKRVLGEEHLDTLTSMNSLALTFKAQDRNEEAISLMGNCFQLRKQILGHEHPYTTSSLATLNKWQLEDIDIRV
jgi:tetratricopeptide (TPR) repeat protein